MCACDGRTIKKAAYEGGFFVPDQSQITSFLQQRGQQQERRPVQQLRQRRGLQQEQQRGLQQELQRQQQVQLREPGQEQRLLLFCRKRTEQQQPTEQPGRGSCS